jgi:hypothetical protein
MTSKNKIALTWGSAVKVVTDANQTYRNASREKYTEEAVA